MFDTQKKLMRANAVIRAYEKAFDEKITNTDSLARANAHIICQNTIISDLSDKVERLSKKLFKQNDRLALNGRILDLVAKELKEANATIEILNECNTNANKEIRRLSRIKKQDQTEEPESCVSSISITLNGVEYVPKQTNE